MRDPELAARLIAAAVECHLPAGDAEDAAGLGRTLDECAGDRPARRADRHAAVTIHGRTRQQFYSGNADWRAVAAVKQAVKIPVIVNGDITDLDIRTRGTGAIGRRRGDDRARLLWPALDRRRAGPRRWQTAER